MARAGLTLDSSAVWGSEDVVPPDSETVGWLLAMLSADETLRAIVEIQSCDVDAVTEAIRAHDSITDSVRLYRTSERVILKLRMEWPTFYASARDCGVPVVPPVVFRAGTVTLEIRDAGARLAEFIERLERSNHSPTIEWIREDSTPHRLLSVRQREILKTAIELGYYESTRQCTLTELSEHLDIAKSTCSEILHRIEGELIRWYAETVGRVSTDEGSGGRPRVAAAQSVDTLPFTDGATHGDGRAELDSRADTVLDLLSNENVRSLFCSANEPKTIQELAEECDVPQSTAYRVTDRLEGADLLVALDEPGETTSVRYRRTLQSVSVRVADSVSVSCEPFVETDPPT